MRGLCIVGSFLVSTIVLAQPALTFPPPKVTPPDEATLEKVQDRLRRLSSALERLNRLGVRDPALAEVEIYLKAGRWILTHKEFYRESAKWIVPVLEQGILRASQLALGETPWWSAPGQTVARAYRSRIDGSVQPYAVTFPHDYGQDRRKRYPIHVVLHGRDASLTEISFLHRHRGDKPAPKDLAFVQIDVYGRGNNAYRWAGESDVFEAVDHFLAVESGLGRGVFLDPTRVVLRGFSMGGAGTWHIGLHRPDQFVVIGPGAGFTTTHGYIPKLPEKLPDYQEDCLSIYDALDYAENAFNVPVVAYSGEKDAQMKAAVNIEEKLKKLGIPMTHLIAPGLGHQFPPEWQKKAFAEYGKYVEKGKPEYPTKVRFVTYTLRYPGCYWVELLGLEQHYKRAFVEAEKSEEGFLVKTTNVRALRFAMWSGATQEPISVTIDGQKLEKVRPQLARTNELFVYLEKHEGKWAPVLAERLFVERLRTPQKVTRQQGPIDDAFTAPFLCVRGTGKPWHAATGEYAKANLERFAAEWSKYMRGDLPIKDDVDVTPEDIASRHLILFGDPSSNSLIQQMLPKLPLTWTAKEIVWQGKSHDAATHVPVLIYPSPLATDRYVVLNSGHTFHAAEFQGTNALLYPRLGDHALLKLTGQNKDPLAVEVVTAGLFDEHWRVRGKR